MKVCFVDSALLFGCRAGQRRFPKLHHECRVLALFLRTALEANGHELGHACHVFSLARTYLRRTYPVETAVFASFFRQRVSGH